MRRAHRWLVGLTAFCWFAMGPLMGYDVGYCPLTDWHWQVKEARGAKDLPATYIDYLLRKFGVGADPAVIDFVVGAGFAAVVVVAAWMWWREKTQQHHARAGGHAGP